MGLVDVDGSDAQSWYIQGRLHMIALRFNDAYNSYQQAVYRDGRNPTFWCSIGVLYFAINQYPDALDAYGRAIRLNPYISEVWFDLGTLYESCENQGSDAIDAYAKAFELDPQNEVLQTRLEVLRGGGTGDVLQPVQPPVGDGGGRFGGICIIYLGPVGSGEFGPPPPAFKQQRTGQVGQMGQAAQMGAPRLSRDDGKRRLGGDGGDQKRYKPE